MKGRNPLHSSIASKLLSLGMCVDVRIVFSTSNKNEANRFEKKHIAHWKKINPDLANFTAGGEGVSDPPPEVRKVMSDKSKAKWDKPGFREAHSAAMKKTYAARPDLLEASRLLRLGKKQSPETIAKRSASLLGQKRRPEQLKFGQNNPFFGKRHTTASLEKMSDKLMGRIVSEETREKKRETARKKREIAAFIRDQLPPKPPNAPKEKRERKPMSAEHCAKISAARKAAGIPDHVREAHRIAVTGRKRAPFTEETKAKMRVAAAAREAAKRAKKEAA